MQFQTLRAHLIRFLRPRYQEIPYVMPRPKGKKRQPVNLTLPPTTAKNAARLAFKNNESLSQLVGRLLEQYVREQEETRLSASASFSRAA